MKPHVVFVSLPSIPYKTLLESIEKKTKLQQFAWMPMGIMYLSACIKKEEVCESVMHLDYVRVTHGANQHNTIEEFIHSTVEKTITNPPDIFAVSLNFSTSHSFFEVFAKEMKKKWPDTKIIIGGMHSTNSATKLRDNECVDYIALGEAELELPKYITAIGENRKPAIKGIYARDQLSGEIPLAHCDAPANLDDVPSPDWSIIDMAFYSDPMVSSVEYSERAAVGRRAATIQTNRGCPFSCTFCSAHTVHGRKMRYRSIQSVLDEIKWLYEEHGITTFIPIDDLFVAENKRTIEMLRGMRKLNIPGFELWLGNGLSVNMLSEEIIDELALAGVTRTFVAIESGSDYVQRKIIKKRCNLAKAKRMVAYLRKKGVNVKCYFIMGFPGETQEHMAETRDYAIELGADWCHFSIAAPLLGSEMFDEFVALDYIQDDINLWSDTHFYERTFDTAEISAEDLKDYVYRVNLEVNFINNKNLIDGNYEKSIELFQEIVDRYPHHVIARYCLMICYQGLGNTEKEVQIRKSIDGLLVDDIEAIAMYKKYKSMMRKYVTPKQLSGK